MPKIDEGICLYTLEKGGCLNGVYTNEYARGVICNEILKAQHGGKFYPDGVADKYDGYYFDTQGNVAEITFIPNNGGYEIQWYVKSKLTFVGIGFIMNNHQLVAHYKSVKARLKRF